MATLTKDQIQRLMDSGMSVYDIRSAAERNGDTMPGPTLFGAAASPFIKGTVRFGQTVGSAISGALGKPSVIKNTVFQAPGIGTIPIEQQQALNTQQGKQQILGLGAELGANFIPFGRVAKALSPYVGKTLATALGLGASGYGFETGTKLQEGAPNAYTPGLGTAIPAAIPIVGKALSVTAPALRFGLAKASGLTPDEITTIVTRPSEFQAARAENLSRVSLGNLINERFKSLKAEVSDLGKSYQPIRDSGQVVKVTESPFQKVLSRMKIGFDNGKVVLTSESPALSPTDVSSIERLYNQFGQTDTLSSNAYLNLRGAADELANWRKDPTRTSLSERIFKDIRREYDDVAKVQIKGLKELDTEYAPVKKELTELTKEYLQFRDGQWGLKDAAVSKIANASNKGREQVLSRLEKYVPGITQQIQLVRALEGIQAASGNRVGAYAQSLLLGGGLFAAGANPAFALLALAVAMPEVLVPILVSFGKARGFTEGVMRALVGKLVAGKTLTEQELKIYKDAILEHLNKVSPGDQFFDSPLGQRSIDYVKNLKPGLVIEDVTKGGTLPQFNGFDDLSTKLLEKLKGRTTVSRQFIEDLTNSPDLKQPERDLIRRVLGDGDSVDPLVSEAKKYKSAEEYVKAQGGVADDAPNVYWHGSASGDLRGGRTGLHVGTRKAATQALEARIGVPAVGEWDGTRVYGETKLMGAKKLRELEKQGIYKRSGYNMDAPEEDYFPTKVKQYADGSNMPMTVTPSVQPYRIIGEMANTPQTPHPDFKANGYMAGQLKKGTAKRGFFYDNVGEDNTFPSATLPNGGHLKPLQTKSQLTDIWNKAQGSSQISVSDFANKVKSELLPLEAKTSGSSIKPNRITDDWRFTPRYENISLPSEIRGKVADYRERIYNSPIQTSAASTHFGSLKNDVTGKGYFAHSRIEDLPKNTGTRRVIEIQSDLFQKGRLEGEKFKAVDPTHPTESDTAVSRFDNKLTSVKARDAELAKLEPYRNTWHERVIREEVKQAAKDGKTKLQFPTGETAMKIEGLGSGEVRWTFDNQGPATPGELKVGREIWESDPQTGMLDEDAPWVITRVDGDGKFQAMPKSDYDAFRRYIDDKIGAWKEGDIETSGRNESFDISGKVDTNNPIYKFYEKEVGKYLKNKYGAELVTDAQGVKWWEMNVKPEMKKLPIEAFGASALPFIPSTEETKKGNEVTPLPKEWKSEIDKQYKAHPALQKYPGLLEAVLMQESSMGKNDANYNPDIGESAWLVGFTKDAKKELESKGIIVDLNTQAGVIKAMADYLDLKSTVVRENGDKAVYKDPVNLYNQRYKTKAGVPLDAKALGKFRDYIEYFKQ